MNLLTTVTDRLLLDRVKSSKIGRTLAKEIEDKARVDRSALVAEITAARSELEKAQPDLESQLGTALSALEKARGDLREAEETYRRAAQSNRDASAGAEMRISRAENELRATASPLIAEFEVWLSDRFEVWRRNGMPSYHRPSMTPVGPVLTEAEQLENKQLYESYLKVPALFSQAREAAHALRLEVLSEDEISDRLGDLRMRIEEATS